MSSDVLGFQEIDKTKIILVGGKGANLGELSRIEGILVPDGFCISTIAFKRVIEETPSIHELLDQLSLRWWVVLFRKGHRKTYGSRLNCQLMHATCLRYGRLNLPHQFFFQPLQNGTTMK